jgi:hypothetical protein
MNCPGCGAPDDQGCYLGCPELDKPGIHELNLLEPPVMGAGGGLSPMPDRRYFSLGTCERCRHWKRIDAKKIGTCSELSSKMMGMYVVTSREHEDVVWWTLNDFGCVMFTE